MESSFSLVEVNVPSHAELMRQMRNEVRQYMTGNQEEITEDQQQDWFLNWYLPRWARNKDIGYIATFVDQPVGYGLITERDGEHWITGGLIEPARGKGLGRALFTMLTNRAHVLFEEPTVYLDVFESNKRAVQLYEKLGYLAVKHERDVIVMKHDEVPGV